MLNAAIARKHLVGMNYALFPKKHIVHIGTLFHGNDSDADFVALP